MGCSSVSASKSSSSSSGISSDAAALRRGVEPRMLLARTPICQSSDCVLTTVRIRSSLVSLAVDSISSRRRCAAFWRSGSLPVAGTPIISANGFLNCTNLTRVAIRVASSEQRRMIVTQVLTRASGNHGSALLSMMARIWKFWSAQA